LTNSEWYDILNSMNYAQKITKIRERGQLTIPQEIRHVLRWPEEELMVKVETTTSGFKVERLPTSHPQNPNKKLSQAQWQHIFKSMENISKSGKQNVSLTKALRQDRDSHF